MSSEAVVARGVIHGKTIELDVDPGLTEGLQVAVTVQPLATSEEALRRSFGGWADDASELDAFLEGVRNGRDQPRTEPAS
jgi:hypothetical protein